jgi:hypothetical protein
MSGTAQDMRALTLTNFIPVLVQKSDVHIFIPTIYIELYVVISTLCSPYSKRTPSSLSKVQVKS